MSNPPYLPSGDRLPSRGSARDIEGGPNGHVVERATLERMRAAGLQPEVLERRRGLLGPLLAGRAPELEARGRLAEGTREEELLIVAGAA